MTASLSMLRAQSLTGEPWLVHGFSDRRGGVTTVYGRADDLNLGFTREDERASVLENRDRLLRLTGLSRLVTVKQVHSSAVLLVGREDGGPAPDAEADGLITRTSGLLLAIQTADCVPVLVADPETRAVGAFHAGWRGTAARIVEAGVARMMRELGSRPENLLAAIGPSIGTCCYGVGEEVRSKFEEAFLYAGELFDAGNRLDLKAANRRQLLDAGVREGRISVSSDCTACLPERYFSHRGERGVTGRMLSVIGVRGG